MAMLTIDCDRAYFPVESFPLTTMEREFFMGLCRANRLFTYVHSLPDYIQVLAAITPSAH